MLIRHTAVVLLTLGLITAPVAVAAQGPSRVPRIGVIGERSPGDSFLRAFQLGLRELGYTEGQSIVVEYRYAHGALDRVPELAAALAQAVPSLTFQRPAVVDGTDSIRPATLRGLSPDQTLVLVNGTRRHASALVNVNGSVGRGSAAVDLNTLPTGALERIEVLRDGASAQYGSDAIAGVVNLRLRQASSSICVQRGAYFSKTASSRWVVRASRIARVISSLVSKDRSSKLLEPIALHTPSIVITF